ncbi:MAG: hypothetical protein HYV27_17275 [Candidatus Hydrogenedentes bacterium]|nr:hypothetical protein [Candidatus Hydrogenedentota bacterium]
MQEAAVPVGTSYLLRFGRALIFASLFLVGFCGGLIVLNLTPSSVTGKELQAKIDWIDRHSTEVDTIFIGSSHVHHQISPAVFDEITLKCGNPTYSFNLGCFGMVPHEMERVLYTALTEGKRFKNAFVAIGVGAPGTNYPNTQRAIWWHDLFETSIVLADVLSYDVPFQTKYGMLQDHLRHAVLNIGKMGRWRSLFQQPPDTPDLILEELSLTRGYSPIARTAGNEEEYDKLRHALTERMADFEQTRNKLIAQAKVDDGARELTPQEQVSLRLIRRIVKRLESRCDRIILFTPVGYGATFPNLDQYLEGSKAEYWALNDPIRFEQIYNTDKWANLTHLNKEGAEEFTEIIANQFCSFLSAGAR